MLKMKLQCARAEPDSSSSDSVSHYSSFLRALVERESVGMILGFVVHLNNGYQNYNFNHRSYSIASINVLASSLLFCLIFYFNCNRYQGPSYDSPLYKAWTEL